MEEANNLQVLFEKTIIAGNSSQETHQLVLKSRDIIGQQREFAIECQNRCKSLEDLYAKREEKLMHEKYKAEEAARELKKQCDQIRCEIANKESRRDTMLSEKRNIESRERDYQNERERARQRRDDAAWFLLIPIAGLVVAPIVAATHDEEVDRLSGKINSLHQDLNNLEGEIHHNQVSLSDLENKINSMRDQSNSTSQEITNTQEKMKEVREIISFCIQACHVWQELDINGKNLELRASTINNLLQKYASCSESQSSKFFRSRPFTNSAQSFYSDWIDFTKAIQEKSNDSLRFKCELCDEDHNGLPLTKNDMIICEDCSLMISLSAIMY